MLLRTSSFVPLQSAIHYPGSKKIDQSSWLKWELQEAQCDPSPLLVIHLPSLKLQWPLKIGHPKRKLVFQHLPTIYFRCYVSFREGSSSQCFFKKKLITPNFVQSLRKFDFTYSESPDFVEVFEALQKSSDEFPSRYWIRQWREGHTNGRTGSNDFDAPQFAVQSHSAQKKCHVFQGEITPLTYLRWKKTVKPIYFWPSIGALKFLLEGSVRGPCCYQKSGQLPFFADTTLLGKHPGLEGCCCRGGWTVEVVVVTKCSTKKRSSI